MEKRLLECKQLVTIPIIVFSAATAIDRLEDYISIQMSTMTIQQSVNPCHKEIDTPSKSSLQIVAHKVIELKAAWTYELPHDRIITTTDRELLRLFIINGMKSRRREQKTSGFSR